MRCVVLRPAFRTDDVSLRRISLLVMRAREDSSPGSLQDGLVKISPVIERMKRSVAVGSPFERADVASLFQIVRRLPRGSGHEHSAREVVQSSTVSELRDLVSRVAHSSSS